MPAAAIALAFDALTLDPRGSAYLDAVRRRVVIFDGAMGTSLQLQDLTADDGHTHEFVGGSVRRGEPAVGEVDDRDSQPAGQLHRRVTPRGRTGRGRSPLAGGYMVVALLPTGHGPQEVGEPIQKGTDL